MSSCIKDLYDHDLIKNCYKCGNIKLKNNFYKDKAKNDGFPPQCKLCGKNI